MTASTLYLDHFQLNLAPFDQEPDTRIFFPDAGRQIVLENLLADIESGKPFIKLTGSEGTGKTLICRLLEKSLSSEKYQLISLEYTIGSYENHLRTICHILGTREENDDDEERAPSDYVALFKEHLRRIATEERNLILIVDEAENLFLATLERLIRLICDTDDIPNLQILLVGRLDLDTHLDQLAIYCSNVDINTGSILEALSFEETKQYIHFRLQVAGIPGEKYLDLFSDDSVEMIFQAAMGNISLTNSLAEQGLKKACLQGMFQVDEELIQPPQSLEENVSLALFQGYDFLKDNKWWLLAGILLVWVVLVLLWPAGEKREDEIPDEENLEIVMSVEEIVVPPVPDVPEIVERQPVVKKEIKIVEQKPREPVEQMQVEPVTREPEVVTPEKILPEQRAVIIEPDRRKKIVPVEPIAVKETPRRDADALYQERLKATSTWIAWAYRGGYTVQLMVLASEKAEDNLKKILIDDKYYEIKDHLFILNKISPKTIYVFYGNYSSMAEGRHARDNMPSFLRKNQPYVLPIQDALDKVEE